MCKNSTLIKLHFINNQNIRDTTIFKRNYYKIFIDIHELVDKFNSLLYNI